MNVQAAAISPTTLLVTWEPPPEDSRNGVIRRYTVNITDALTGANRILTSNETQATVTGLHPYYVYWSSVAAETVAPGPWSERAIVEMPEDGKAVPGFIC